jgi:hypothetical protein
MPLHTLCSEVLEFIQAIEELLSPDTLDTSFTTEEYGIVGYYLMAMSHHWPADRFSGYRCGMQSVTAEIENFERAAQSLIAVAMLPCCALTEKEEYMVAYFLTRLQEELVLPGQ